MKHHRLLLAAVAGTGILAVFASQALPLDALRLNGAMTGVVKVEREHEGEGHRDGHRRHDDDDDRYAANNCRGQGRGHDDDDDGRDACGGLGAPMQQNAKPPSNSLFTPGSKPRAEMN